MPYIAEYTDTFGGEANYSWVKRASIEFGDDPSDVALMRRAKAALGLSGVPGRTFKHGDMMEFRPYGMCCVLFVTYREEV